MAPSSLYGKLNPADSSIESSSALVCDRNKWSCRLIKGCRRGDRAAIILSKGGIIKREICLATVVGIDVEHAPFMGCSHVMTLVLTNGLLFVAFSCNETLARWQKWITNIIGDVTIFRCRMDHTPKIKIDESYKRPARMYFTNSRLTIVDWKKRKVVDSLPFSHIRLVAGIGDCLYISCDDLRTAPNAFYSFFSLDAVQYYHFMIHLQNTNEELRCSFLPYHVNPLDTESFYSLTSPVATSTPIPCPTPTFGKNPFYRFFHFL